MTLALTRLISVIPAFPQRYPDLCLELLLQDDHQDLIAEDINLALRGSGQVADSGLVARPLLTLEHVLCAAPAYLGQHGQPLRPEVLREHECIHFSFSGYADRWISCKGRECIAVPIAGRYWVSFSLVVRDALLAGSGLSLIPRLCAQAELVEGRLVGLLAGWKVGETAIHVVYPSRQLAGETRVSLDFLTEIAAQGHDSPMLQPQRHPSDLTSPANSLPPQKMMPVMPHRQRASDRDLWSRTLSLVFLGFLCYAFPWTVFAAFLPIPSDDALAPRIQSSNIIGTKLLPALVEGLMEEEGLEDTRRIPGERENELHLLGKSRDGRLVRVELPAHDSSIGFAVPLERHVGFAAASRPVKDNEVRALAGFSDLRSPYVERVIAIDGPTIILYPDNPLVSLDIAQLVVVLASEVCTRGELGDKGSAIRLYARDEQSSTYDTFKELVLASHGRNLTSDARRFESNDWPAAVMSAGPYAIGLVGIASVGRARASAIAGGGSLPMTSQESLTVTEGYPLLHRLFLHLKPSEKNPWVQALARFAQGPRGQTIVARSGSVVQKIRAIQVVPRPQMPAEYRKLAEQAWRLTVNFHFQEGSALFDNKVLLDIQRLLDYLRQNRKLQKRTMLVGFGDPKPDAERSVLFSRLRAIAMRHELARGGVSFREIVGFGDELPAASDDQEPG